LYLSMFVSRKAVIVRLLNRILIRPWPVVDHVKMKDRLDMKATIF
jgi:hypothetical protein